MTAQNDFKDLKQIIQREIGIVKKLENAAEKGKGQQEWIVELQQTNNLLLEALDIDSDGRVETKFSGEEIILSSTETTGIPFTWDSEVQVRLWR